ncbi:hypothetical protein RhiXN_11797 [Rhizoctonia solani]|uniref:Uncharacterized protein n=1 Tax=Rhizoctonia solani TaxID=456999 RepID=A0A8H8P5I4_9AGAM|nr:uncharacterized protein RhiXN_11797 [Rhizoctonia solani]QRW24885.1 hypothetical protein RhiXN_11797 [Rhizoctonia solani]
MARSISRHMQCTPMKIRYHQGLIFSASHLDVVIPPTVLGGAESVLTSSYGVLVSTSLSYTGGQGIKQAIFADFYLRFPTFLRAQASVASGVLIFLLRSSLSLWLTIPPQSELLLLIPSMGQYSLDEVTEVYLKRVDWEQVGRAYTNSDVLPVVNSYSFSETNSMCKERETSFSSGIGGVIKGIGINLGTEYKTITSDFSSTTNSQTVQYTVQPGETVYYYVKAYKLTVRKWWLVDLHGQANQVVTQDHSLNSTHLGIREGIIYREKRISTTRLSGSKVLPVGQIARSWSDEHGGNARIKHWDLPSAVLSVIKDRHQKIIS